MAPNDDERFGLPLLRARFHLVPAEITAPNIVASDRRHALQRGDFIPGDPWRYETFVVPPDGAAERWASWENRQADPLIDAEAERQNTWLAVSLELRARLEDGRLEGFARRNDIAAEYLPIPPAAWPLLRVPFDPTFKNWRIGYAEGAGLKLWGIRILDRSGLRLEEAAIAYGPAVDAAFIQRKRAYRTSGADEATRVRSDPASTGDRAANRDDSAAAESRLLASLQANLRAGNLIGFGQRDDGAMTAIARSDWQKGAVTISASELRTLTMSFANVTVRPPHPVAEAPGDGSRARQWANEDVQLWWDERVHEHAEGRWPFNRDEDWDAAAKRFPGIARGTVDELRKGTSPRAKQGRRKRRNPPKKSATPI